MTLTTIHQGYEIHRLSDGSYDIIGRDGLLLRHVHTFDEALGVCERYSGIRIGQQSNHRRAI